MYVGFMFVFFLKFLIVINLFELSVKVIFLLEFCEEIFLVIGLFGFVFWIIFLEFVFWIVLLIVVGFYFFGLMILLILEFVKFIFFFFVLELCLMYILI